MRISQTKKVTYRRWDYRHGGIPALIISGLFLRDYGFPLGEKVRIEYYKNKIIITKPGSIENMLLTQGEQSHGGN